MLRRPTTQGFLLASLVLCAGVWLGSQFYGVVAVHKRTSTVTLALGSGKLYYRTHLSMISSTWRPPGWSVDFARLGTGTDSLHGDFLGFTVRRLAPVGSTPNWLVIVPLWFPTVLCGVAYAILRRSGRRRGPGRGFPVELMPKQAATPPSVGQR